MYHVSEYEKANPDWVHGIDISYHQDNENYVENLALAKKAGYEFCIIRATQGKEVDSRLEHNFDLAMDAGIIIGFYHYWRNNVGMNGYDQAKFHVDTITPFVNDAGRKVLPSYIDVERYYNKLGSAYKIPNSGNIYGWLDFMESSLMGGGMYSSKWMWQLMTNEPFWANACPGWVAQWTGLPEPTLYPRNWNKELTKFWQWGVAGKDLGYKVPPYVPGLKGECDLDIFMGTLDELKKLAGHEEIVPPEKIHTAFISVEIDGQTFTGRTDLELDAS